MCICHPHLRWMNIRRARIIIGCIAVIVMILGIIISLHFSVYGHEVNQHNITDLEMILNQTEIMNLTQMINLGYCDLHSKALIDETFFLIVEYSYRNLFPVSCGVVLVLYILILRSDLCR